MAVHALNTAAPRRRTRPVARANPLPGIPFPDVESIAPIYAMKLSGTCLSPDLNDGDVVKFSATEKPERGDFSIFIFRPELVEPGRVQCIIKRLSMGIPPWVQLPYRENPNSDVHALVVAEQLNPPRQYMIKAENLLAIHRFVGVRGARE